MCRASDSGVTDRCFTKQLGVLNKVDFNEKYLFHKKIVFDIKESTPSMCLLCGPIEGATCLYTGAKGEKGERGIAGLPGIPAPASMSFSPLLPYL